MLIPIYAQALHLALHSGNTLRGALGTIWDARDSQSCTTQSMCCIITSASRLTFIYVKLGLGEENKLEEWIKSPPESYYELVRQVSSFHFSLNMLLTYLYI